MGKGHLPRWSHGIIARGEGHLPRPVGVRGEVLYLTASPQHFLSTRVRVLIIQFMIA